MDESTGSSKVITSARLIHGFMVWWLEALSLFFGRHICEEVLEEVSQNDQNLFPEVFSRRLVRWSVLSTFMFHLKSSSLNRRLIGGSTVSICRDKMGDVFLEPNMHLMASFCTRSSLWMRLGLTSANKMEAYSILLRM